MSRERCLCFFYSPEHDHLTVSNIVSLKKFNELTDGSYEKVSEDMAFNLAVELGILGEMQEHGFLH